MHDFNEAKNKHFHLLNVSRFQDVIIRIDLVRILLRSEFASSTDMYHLLLSIARDKFFSQKNYFCCV